MIRKEDAIPLVVGVGDGLSDTGIKYLDKVTGTEGKPVLKRASTWTHVGVATIAGVLSIAYLRGNARVMGLMISGRHFGKFAGDIAEAYAEGHPILEVEGETSPDVEVIVEEVPQEGEKKEETVKTIETIKTVNDREVAEAVIDL